MNKKFVLLTFGSVLLLSAVIGVQLAAAVVPQRIPGVSPGDWAEYDVTYSGNATMPPPDETTEWVKLTVQEVSGTNITSQQIMRYADHHEETGTFVVDVDTGQGNGTGIFIAKNLNEDDLIYTDPPPTGPFGISFQGATINETIFRTYPVGTVEVNHLNITMVQTLIGWTQTTSTNFYWFRATGMITEMSWYMLSQPDVGDATWMKIEAVIIDIVPEFPQALILPLFVIATLAAVWLGKAIWSAKKLTRKPAPYA